MKELKISRTTKSPEISFYPDGKLDITGISVPENPMAFYQPIIEWVREYVASPAKKTTLTFKLSYINTGSLQFVYDILFLLATLNKNDVNMKIDWYYLDDDIDMKETGEDFSSSVNIPFNLVAIPEV